MRTYHSISCILQQPLSTIFTSHRHHKPKPPKEPSNHNNMSSRHVKPFSSIRIYSLNSIVVTFVTSHWLRFPLKAEAELNTVARKEGRLHSQSTRKKRRRKSHHTWLHQPKPYMTSNHTCTSLNPRACLDHVTSSSNIQEYVQVTLRHPQTYKSMFRSRYVILSHTYRLDVMYAGDTNQTTSTQTLLSPNALALSPTTTTKLIFILAQPTTQLEHSKPRNVQ